LRIKSLVPLFASTAVLLALAGCQRALNAGAVNSCGSAIEVNANDAPAPEDSEWVSVDQGQRRYVLSASESAEQLYVWVRSPGKGHPIRFEVLVAELVGPPADAGYETRVDREIVLEGDRCPSR
jgi:hypothetical protein